MNITFFTCLLSTMFTRIKHLKSLVLDCHTSYSTEGQHLTSYLLVQVFLFFTRNASKSEIKSSGCYKASEPTALKINNLDLALQLKNVLNITL
jgi:hypothetical protein